MRCLVIYGSPRRGNTYDVLEKVILKLKDIENLDIEIIELRKENIPLCIGCFNCILKGEDRCPHRNNMESLIKKINEAEVLIFTSPVYSMQISGLMKNFIDHLSFNFHRPKFIGKKALVITTTAGAGHKNSANYLRDVLKYHGITEVITLPIAYRASTLNDKNLKLIDKQSGKFKSIIENKNIKNASFKQVMLYNFWRGMDKSEGMEADEKFYLENNRVYYDESKVNFIYKIFGNLAYKIIKK